MAYTGNRRVHKLRSPASDRPGFARGSKGAGVSRLPLMPVSWEP